jgi:hypothetical protein
MRMATWNVQGCRGKIIKKMEQLGIDIASIMEINKKGSGSEVIGNYLHFCRAKRGVSLLIHKKWKHNTVLLTGSVLMNKL